VSFLKKICKNSKISTGTGPDLPFTITGSISGLAAAYIHKDLDINPDEILKLYTQMNSGRFDFGV
jgi:hypothetical protein